MRLTTLPAAALVALSAACGSSSLSTSTAAKLIAPDYPAVAPLKVPHTFTVEKGSAKDVQFQAVHAILQKEAGMDIQAKVEGTKVTYTYALTARSPKAARAEGGGFHIPAASVEFVKVTGVETRQDQARATYLVRLVKPTPIFPAFQLVHPGAQTGQTKVRHAEFDKQGGKWGLLKTDEKMEIKD